MKMGLVQGAFENFRDQAAGGATLILPLGLIALILAPAWLSIGLVIMLFLNGNLTGLRCSPQWYRKRRNNLQSRMAFEDVKGEVRMARLGLMGWWAMGLLCWPPILIIMLVKVLYELSRQFWEKVLEKLEGRQISRNVEEIEVEEIGVVI